MDEIIRSTTSDLLRKKRHGIYDLMTSKDLQGKKTKGKSVPLLLETYLHTKTYMWKFTDALFIRAKRQKQHKCQSMDEWVNKMWYIHRID